MVNLHDSATGNEFNANVAAAYFPYSEYVAARVNNGSTNNGPLNVVQGTTGITVGTTGTTIIDSTSNAGVYDVNLSGFTASSAVLPVAATSTNGILLVGGGKNEDNYAAGRANGDGTFTLFVRDNGTDSTGSGENDGVNFAFVPLNDVNTLAVARVRGDGTSIIGSGSYTVVKIGTGQYALQIAGATDAGGTLLVTPEADAVTGTVTSDNVVSYEWDAPNSRWIIETRDITATVPALEDAGAADPAFSFAFFVPEPTAFALLAPLGLILGRRRRAHRH